MGCCCGKEQIVVAPAKEGVMNRRPPSPPPFNPPPAPPPPIPPPPHPPVAAKYTGPPPEYFIEELRRIEDECDHAKEDLAGAEVVGRDRLVDWLMRAVAAQTAIEMEAAAALRREGERNLFLAEEGQARHNIDDLYGHALLALGEALARAIRDQELDEMLRLDVGELGHGLANEDDGVGELDDPNAFNVGDVFGPPRVLGDDEISARSANSRHSTLSAMDWDDALRSRKEFSPSASQRSMGQPSPLRSLLDRHPILKLEIDEVGARDEISRDGLGLLATMRLDAFQHEAILTRRRYTYPRLLEAHFCFIVAVCEQVEGYHRADLEHQWLRGLQAVYSVLFKAQAKKMQWDGEMRKMEERRARKTAAQKALRDEERRADKLRWEIERMRLEETRHVSAADRLRAELDEARQNGTHFTVASPGRITREHVRQQGVLAAEESRFRGSVSGEEHARWQLLWDRCAEECPWIVNHPQRDAFIAKRNAEVAKWQLIANGIVARENTAGVLAGEVDARSLQAAQRNARHRRAGLLSANSRLRGRFAVLAHAEVDGRAIAQHAEGVAWSRLLDAIADDAAISMAHARRRRVRAWDAGREARLAEQQAHAIWVLQKSGRGYVWRARLGPIVPVKFEVADLIAGHARGHKNIVQQEHIQKGDLFHYLVQEGRLTALLEARARWPPERVTVPLPSDAAVALGDGREATVSTRDREEPASLATAAYLVDSDCAVVHVNAYLLQMFPRIDARDYSWDPTVVIPVEQLARESLWREFMRSYDSTISLPALIEVEVIRGMPQHLIGVRLRSVVCIQKAYRCYRLRSEFNTKHRDRMVFAKLQRVKRRAELRMLKETEREARYAIEDEYDALGLHRLATRDECFSRWDNENLAAAKIQALYRGMLVRSQRDPRLLAFLKNKLRFLQEKERRRRQM